MPRPHSGESQSDYIKRFMSSSEAQGDFPDEKQRLAVAYSMFRKNSANELTWPKAYQANFIEQGVCAYQDLGPCKVCGDAFSCAAGCEPTGATVLLKEEAIARFARSLVGKPITMDHQDVSPATLVDGEAHGVVTRVWKDPESGWWNAEYLAWTPEAQKASDTPGYSVSCAYDPTKTRDEEGEWHAVPYAAEILDGEMTHLALVTNPRYEGARINPMRLNSKILVNSKTKKQGGSMLEGLKGWFKGGSRKNALPVNPDDKVDLGNGKEATFKDLVSALEPEKPKWNDDSVFETPHGEKSLKELKDAYMAKQNAAGEPSKAEGGETLDPAAKAAGAEAGHAEHREGERANAEGKCDKCGQALKNKEPLPDPKDPKANDAEDAAKKADAAAKEKEALERQQAKDRADQEEKEALQNAKKAAAAKHFEDLRNARSTPQPEGRIQPVGMPERLEKGKAKYGRA